MNWLYLPVINASFNIDFLKAWTLIVDENDPFAMTFLKLKLFCK